MSLPSVLFDLDGVISDTASVHASAWKQVFDDVLAALGKSGNPFLIDVDYPLHVDGKMRLDGIECFLRSRDVVLPLGGAEDATLKTIHGIGNLKNGIFHRLLSEAGVTIFEDARRLIESMLRNQFELGLASSSKNARTILDKAGMVDCFKVIMDGLLAEQHNVSSKPSPEFYSHAAALLGRPVTECVVIEDAISGVISARAAGIGYVIGIARKGNGNELTEVGADTVVTSLDEVSIDQLRTGVAAGSCQQAR